MSYANIFSYVSNWTNFISVEAGFVGSTQQRKAKQNQNNARLKRTERENDAEQTPKCYAKSIILLIYEWYTCVHTSALPIFDETSILWASMNVRLCVMWRHCVDGSLPDENLQSNVVYVLCCTPNESKLEEDRDTHWTRTESDFNGSEMWSNPCCLQWICLHLWQAEWPNQCRKSSHDNQIGNYAHQ